MIVSWYVTRFSDCVLSGPLKT